MRPSPREGAADPRPRSESSRAASRPRRTAPTRRQGCAIPPHPVLGYNYGASSEGRAGILPHTGRHCHSTLPLTVIHCHCLGVYTVILLPLLSLSVEITVSPLAAPRRPAWAWRGAPGRPRAPPRVRSQCRFSNRGTEYVSRSGIKWMSGSTKRQCDRTLAPPARDPRAVWRD
jgi:hypothetical protein